MADPELGATGGPVAGAVAGAVVREDPFDGDPPSGEPGDRPVRERDTVRSVLDAGELRIGQPRVGVDRGVDVGVTDSLATTGLFAAELLVAPARWDPGEFLHVDVDQLAAAAGLDAADHPSDRTVHPRQPVHPVPDQDPMDRRRRDPDDAGETGRAELAGLA